MKEYNPSLDYVSWKAYTEQHLAPDFDSIKNSFNAPENNDNDEEESFDDEDEESYNQNDRYSLMARQAAKEIKGKNRKR